MGALTDVPGAEKKGRKGAALCSPKGIRTLLSEEAGRAAGGEAWGPVRFGMRKLGRKGW